MSLRSSVSRSRGRAWRRSMMGHPRCERDAGTSSSVHGRGRHRSIPDGGSERPSPCRPCPCVSTCRPAGPARSGMAGPLDLATARAVAAYDAAADRRDDRALGFLVRAADRTVAGPRPRSPGCASSMSPAARVPPPDLAAEAVAPHGRVLGMDLSEAMLDGARDKAQPGGSRRRRASSATPTWRTTGLPDESFDAVVCVFGLVLVPDMVEPRRRAVADGAARRPAHRHDLGSAAVVADGRRLEGRRRRGSDRTSSSRATRGSGSPTRPRWPRSCVAAGVPTDGLTVTPEFERWPLLAPRDWWSIVMGSGLRWTVDQLDRRRRGARPRSTCLDYARRHRRRLDHLQRALRAGDQAAR